MKEIELSEIQINTLIGALSFVSIDENFDHEIEIISYNAKASDGRSTGVQCQYFLNKEGVKYEYLFFIGYYDPTIKRNPETIGVWQRINDNKVLQTLGNLAYITDKLREYKVW